MVLTEKEEELISVIRKLAPQEAGKVLGWAHQLEELAQGGPVEWSDEWTEDDLRDASRAAVQNLER